MTINREAIAYAHAKILEVKTTRILPEHLEMELHYLAIDDFNARSESQVKAERAAKRLNEFIEKLKPRGIL